MVVFSGFVSGITSAMSHLDHKSAEKKHQIWLLRKYLREQQVSKMLAERIGRNAFFMLSIQGLRVQPKDVPILSQLSGQLKVELETELFRPSLVLHPLFQLIMADSVDLFQAICCQNIKQEILSPGDLLFKFRTEGRALYWLMRGSLHYSHKYNDELSCNVQVGQWFCEATLWTHWRHTGKMLAKVDSDLLKLDAVQFHMLLPQFQKEAKIWVQHAVNFLEKLNNEPGHVSDVVKKVAYPYMNLGRAE